MEKFFDAYEDMARGLAYAGASRGRPNADVSMTGCPDSSIHAAVSRVPTAGS
ncbi:MAG: hypothetical protein IIZ47_01505 [Erysipelotrichaceae bacterium]|nr:hypothetical protein [Erysipelotrichaceae bacterium]